MTFWGNGVRVLRRTFVYSGRASRAEFWWWMRLLSVVVLVVFAVLAVLDTSSTRAVPSPGILWLGFVNASVLVALAGFFPTLALTVRRLHDTGRSGLAVLVWFLLPFFAWLIFLGLAFAALGQALTTGSSEDAPSLVALAIAVGVSLVVAGWAIWWLRQDGDDGPNQFGDNTW